MGIKLVSREIMEEEDADKLRKERIMDTTQSYSTLLAKRVENILKTFDEKLYISTKSQYNFVIKDCYGVSK